jgi:hypothetical protein
MRVHLPIFWSSCIAHPATADRTTIVRQARTDHRRLHLLLEDRGAAFLLSEQTQLSGQAKALISIIVFAIGADVRNKDSLPIYPKHAQTIALYDFHEHYDSGTPIGCWTWRY